ncbi:hypothetical protein, partial [Nitrosomonas sp.]|uniref:hypothetical protein n=1 Tax=Nitrosomonas sp. TaxID=42353 RepID=UPI00272F7344
QVRTSLLGIGYGSWPWQFLFDGFVWVSMRLINRKNRVWLKNLSNQEVFCRRKKLLFVWL